MQEALADKMQWSRRLLQTIFVLLAKAGYGCANCTIWTMTNRMTINRYNNILVVVCCWQVSHLCLADVFHWLAVHTHLEGVVSTMFTWSVCNMGSGCELRTPAND